MLVVATESYETDITNTFLILAAIGDDGATFTCFVRSNEHRRWHGTTSRDDELSEWYVESIFSSKSFSLMEIYMYRKKIQHY